ncbi:MAG: iron ABC transporter permease [Lachnospiraceae bacterium]|nr:iron ABC transporter permease [Lachnospiraceae bacterium]
MQSDRRMRYLISFLILGIGMVMLLIFNICIGSVRISFGEILRSLGGTDITNERIIWDIRFPRAVAAMILGGALSLSGYLLQTFFRNPIAGPFVLGISSGAKMVVAIVMIFLMGRAIRVNSLTLIAAAFVGSMISMGFVLVIAGRVDKMSTLIVSGIMIGYICSAVTEILITFAGDAEIVNLHNWSRGSFSGISWDNIPVMSVVVLLAFIMTVMIAKQLEAYTLGDSYAMNLGVNLKGLRALMVILTGILSASVVAFAGPVSFVGIAVPHLVKAMMKSAKPIIMIPASFLGGGISCLLCDLIARTLIAPTELSISSVTAVFGAPVVLWVMINRNRKRMS